MKVKRLFPVLIFALLIATCRAGAASPELALPDVPDSLRTPAARAAYVVAHYFDKLPLVPPEAIANQDWLEENFANFLGLVPYAGDKAEESARAGFAGLLQLADIHQVDELAEVYLHAPDSPSFDENLYLSWLQVATEKSPDNMRRDMFAHKTEITSRNLPGTIAQDFTFSILPGRNGNTQRKLSEIPGERLLIFFDPDCSTCRKIIKRLSDDSRVKNAVGKGLLTVVAVYHDAEEQYLPDAAALLPEEWIGGYEEGAVSEDELYELILAPTIYLIDGEGKVVQRNPSLKDIRIPS